MMGMNESHTDAGIHSLFYWDVLWGEMHMTRLGVRIRKSGGHRGNITPLEPPGIQLHRYYPGGSIERSWNRWSSHVYMCVLMTARREWERFTTVTIKLLGIRDGSQWFGYIMLSPKRIIVLRIADALLSFSKIWRGKEPCEIFHIDDAGHYMCWSTNGFGQKGVANCTALTAIQPWQGTFK